MYQKITFFKRCVLLLFYIYYLVTLSCLTMLSYTNCCCSEWVQLMYYFVTCRYDPYYQHEKPLLDAGRLLTLRENQMLLRNETKNRTSVDCCPSVLEMVEPKGGTNQEDKYVELYRDGVTRQRFYELSCHRDIVDKPCRYVSGNAGCIIPMYDGSIVIYIHIIFSFKLSG